MYETENRGGPKQSIVVVYLIWKRQFAKRDHVSFYPPIEIILQYQF